MSAHRGHVVMRRYSPAFVAYTEMPELPEHVPNFDTDDNDCPIVHLGELFCRMPGLGRGTICGAKFTTRDHVMNHVTVFHGVLKENLRGIRGGQHTGAYVRASLRFYINVMKHEDYLGKEGPLETAVDTMSIKPRPRSRKTLEGNDGRAMLGEDDDVELSYPPRRSPRRKAALPSFAESNSAELNYTPRRNLRRRLPFPSDAQSDDAEMVDGDLIHGQGHNLGEGDETTQVLSDLQPTAPVRIETAGDVQPTLQRDSTPAMTRQSLVIDMSEDVSEAGNESSDGEEAQAQLESFRIQRDIKRIELEEKRIELEELLLKQRLVARKKSRRS
ncbi:uncharacterized protein RCC_01793 [Ramularia collo-cygni]|uniref:Uncharacterized protein n=1 Tax=Ramularia collo-cygni TaxID=112498 RepID=A0A2D3V0G3_9PEZI|nr:uncharacterized protein RCC_01793 [Ramularia collo-cygni]CZT15954.1 uncharacterized protein RCC_01793 [Ramularia collo-cygni]